MNDNSSMNPQGGNFSAGSPYGYSTGYRANDGRADYMVPIHTVRQLLSSVPVFAGALCFSLYILIFIAGAAAGEASSYISLISDGTGAFAFSSLYTTLLAVAGSVPDIIMAVGIWLIFSAAAKRSVRCIKTTGLTMIKVITIIKFVLSMVFFVLVIIILAAAAVLLRSDFSLLSDVSSEDAQLINIIMIVLLAVMAGLCAVMAVYYVMLIKSLDTIKNTVSSGRPSSKVSAYAAVISFFEALCLAASAAGMLSEGYIIMPVSFLLYAAALVLFGIFLLVYKSRLRSMTDGMIFY